MVCGDPKAGDHQDPFGLPFPHIIICADSGFSCAAFYELADQYALGFVMGLATKEVLKRKVKRT